MAKEIKTNAMRILDSNKINFSVSITQKLKHLNFLQAYGEACFFLQRAEQSS